MKRWLFSCNPQTQLGNPDDTAPVLSAGIMALESGTIAE